VCVQAGPSRHSARMQHAEMRYVGFVMYTCMPPSTLRVRIHCLSCAVVHCASHVSRVPVCDETASSNFEWTASEWTTVCTDNITSTVALAAGGFKWRTVQCRATASKLVVSNAWCELFGAINARPELSQACSTVLPPVVPAPAPAANGTVTPAPVPTPAANGTATPAPVPAPRSDAFVEIAIN